MFQDKHQTLEQFEAELLAAESPELSTDEVPAASAHCKVYNTDATDTDLEAYSAEVCHPKGKKDLLVLTVIALCLTAGILGVLVYWLIRFF